MRLNPSPSRFFIRHAEAYEKGCALLRLRHPFIDPQIQNIEDLLRKTPHSEGYPCDAFPGRDIRYHVAPRTTLLPAIRVLYEIEDPRVVCWVISEKSDAKPYGISADIIVLRPS